MTRQPRRIKQKPCGGVILGKTKEGVGKMVGVEDADIVIDNVRDI